MTSSPHAAGRVHRFVLTHGGDPVGLRVVRTQEEDAVAGGVAHRTTINCDSAIGDGALDCEPLTAATIGKAERTGEISTRGGGEHDPVVEDTEDMFLGEELEVAFTLLERRRGVSRLGVLAIEIEHGGDGQLTAAGFWVGNLKVQDVAEFLLGLV